MNHVTLHDLLDHELTGAPLPCSYDHCREALEALRHERSEPRRATESLPSGFWSRQEERLNRRLPVRGFWMPLLATAGLILALALGVLLTPQSVETPSSLARLSEQEQEELLLEVDAILDSSPMGEYDILLEDAATPDQNTLLIYEGGSHEA